MLSLYRVKYHIWAFMPTMIDMWWFFIFIFIFKFFINIVISISRCVKTTLVLHLCDIAWVWNGSVYIRCIIGATMLPMLLSYVTQLSTNWEPHTMRLQTGVLDDVQISVCNTVTTIWDEQLQSWIQSYYKILHFYTKLVLN